MAAIARPQSLKDPVTGPIPPRWLLSIPSVIGDIQAFREVPTPIVIQAVSTYETAVTTLGPGLDDNERQAFVNNPSGAGLPALCNRGLGVIALIGRYPALVQLSGYSADQIQQLCYQRVGYLGADAEISGYADEFAVAPLLLGAYAGEMHRSTMSYLGQQVLGKDPATEAKTLAPFRPVLGLAAQVQQTQQAQQSSVHQEQQGRSQTLNNLRGQATYEQVLADLQAGRDVSDEDLETAEAYLDAQEAQQTQALLNQPAPATAPTAKVPKTPKVPKTAAASNRRSGSRG